MQKINIGSIIARQRKEKGITQEELANYLGVSKPAVSKWESGQSYPDITLLPVLAAYFNRSVDDLLGYEKQMPSEEIKKLYLRLADAFAAQPFDEVIAQCREHVKTYYSCWSLLFAMAELLINHAPLAGSPERVNAVMEEAAALFQRVETESGDAVLARQALSMRAYCYLALQQPAAAVDLLDNIDELTISSDILLAKAYLMKGDTERSIELLQTYLYKNVLSLFGAFPDLMTCYADRPEKMEDCLQKVLGLGEVFGIQAMHPAVYLTLYLTAAALFASQNRKERALDMLEAYADLCRKDLFPLKLHGNAFFDRLDTYFASLNLGTSAPRSDKLIIRDLKGSVEGNPVFQSLAGEERFQRVLRRLGHLREEEL